MIYEHVSPTKVCSHVLVSSEVDYVGLVDGLWQVSSLTQSVQQLPGCQLVPPLVHPRSNGRETSEECGRQRGREKYFTLFILRVCASACCAVLSYTSYKTYLRLYSHTVGLRQAAHGSIFGQEAILQVDHRLSDLLVFGQHVVVVQHHPQVLLQREGTGELEHPERTRGIPEFWHINMINPIFNVIFSPNSVPCEGR